MGRKPTGDLQRELMSQPSLEAYMKANQGEFCDRSAAELLSGLYKRSGIRKADLARQAGMSEVYVHQVFSGRRKPSRDRLLCLCIGLGASLEETQTLLKHVGYAVIYPRIKRDAIIGYGISHGTSLYEINDRLFMENEKSLF